MVEKHVNDSNNTDSYNNKINSNHKPARKNTAQKTRALWVKKKNVQSNVWQNTVSDKNTTITKSGKSVFLAAIIG